MIPTNDVAQAAALTGLARYNVTPLGVIALVSLVVHVLPAARLGFLLAGALAAGGYALSISLVEVVTRR